MRGGLRLLPFFVVMLGLIAPAAEASGPSVSMALKNGTFEMIFNNDDAATADDVTLSAVSPTQPRQYSILIEDPGTTIHNQDDNCHPYNSVDETYRLECFIWDGTNGTPDLAKGGIIVSMGGGEDSFHLGDGFEVGTLAVNGGAGRDALDMTFGSTGAIFTTADIHTATVDGGPGNDVIRASGARGTVAGGGGNDSIVLGSATTNCPLPRGDGGPGIDQLTVSCGKLDLTRTPHRHFESYVGADIKGTKGRDVLLTPPGGGRLDGRGGNDLLTGDVGNDTILGGPGNDTVSDKGGTNTVRGGPDNDFIGVAGASALFGDGGDDRLTAGNDPSSELHGGPGGDRLRCGPCAMAGDAGDDRLLCFDHCTMADGPGKDFVRGGASVTNGDVVTAGPGRDVYRGGGEPAELPGCYYTFCGGGGDEISYAQAGRPVTVSDNAKADDGVRGEHDNVMAFALIVGSPFGDTLSAKGPGGGDIDGGAGDDHITGSLKGDLLEGGAGDDVVSAGSGDDAVDGGDGNDTVKGGADNDKLLGGLGDDKLFGETGDDTLTGGGGLDTFGCGAGDDTVTDVETGEPRTLCETPQP